MDTRIPGDCTGDFPKGFRAASKPISRSNPRIVLQLQDFDHVPQFSEQSPLERPPRVASRGPCAPCHSMGPQGSVAEVSLGDPNREVLYMFRGDFRPSSRACFLKPYLKSSPNGF